MKTLQRVGSRILEKVILGYKTSKKIFFLRGRERIDSDKFSKVNVLRKESLEAEVGSFILMKVKEESENVGFKLNIQKTKIMASGPITSWQIDGEAMETVRLFFGAPKSLQMVTAAMKLKDTCSLGKKL